MKICSHVFKCSDPAILHDRYRACCVSLPTGAADLAQAPAKRSATDHGAIVNVSNGSQAVIGNIERDTGADVETKPAMPT